MFPLPSAGTHEAELSAYTGVSGSRTPHSRSSVGHEQTQYVPPYPSTGQGNKYQSQGVTRASSVSQIGQRGQSMGRGRG